MAINMINSNEERIEELLEGIASSMKEICQIGKYDHLYITYPAEGKATVVAHGEAGLDQYDDVCPKINSLTVENLAQEFNDLAISIETARAEAVALNEQLEAVKLKEKKKVHVELRKSSR